ncbi:hypothetical protein DMH03_34005 [Amycolatopsis sp. WAC 01376]|uniref:hypothetical protein n=1 Tax=Amycolatopsis sp. WAC 01376 TaxID=2203195 RepID=UPI001003D22B|nr:hypothetical protein [Amycolatopsis sp. WAC 01376]RSM55192.1 hypothetical protein DMH03_34005 [Amycolatopsis sp. WAC 01376]
MVRVVSGVGCVGGVVVVVTGDCGTSAVVGVVTVVEGATLPLPDPPPAHAPSSAPAPTTRPNHHIRMAGP